MPGFIGPPGIKGDTGLPGQKGDQGAQGENTIFLTQNQKLLSYTYPSITQWYKIALELFQIAL